MNRDVWIEAGRLSDEGHGFCLAVIETSRGSVPRRAGSVMLVRSDGTTIGTVGGGDFERMAAKEALEVLAENKPRTVEYDLHDPQGEEIQAVCGGHLTILMLPQAGRMALHLFGAGHVARPVCKLAAMTGYTVIVYDETDNWATRENFPDATTFRTGSLADAAANLEWNPQDAVVILTGAHTIDFEILRQFKDRIPPYLGIIASKKKASYFHKQLQENGWQDSDIEKVHMPIGLDINSRTPAEIAVSILAEIMKERGPVE